MVLICLSGRSGDPRGQGPLVRDLRHNTRLGQVWFYRFFKFTMVVISVGWVLFNSKELFSCHCMQLPSGLLESAYLEQEVMAPATPFCRRGWWSSSNEFFRQLSPTLFRFFGEPIRFCRWVTICLGLVAWTDFCSRSKIHVTHFFDLDSLASKRVLKRVEHLYKQCFKWKTWPP